jgi:hypothetical protein
LKINSEVKSVLPFSNPSPRSSVLPLEKEENRYEVELEN